MSRGRTARMACAVVIAAVLGGFIYIMIWRSRAQTAEAHFQSFVIQMQNARYGEAQRHIQAALEICPDDAYYRSNLGLVYERSLPATADVDKYPFRRSQGLDRDNVLAVDEAVHAYVSAIVANPNDACFHHNLGWLYWMSGSSELALDSLRRATAIDPATPVYHISLGMLYEQSRAFAEAAAQYQAALNLSPAILDSRFFRDPEDRSPAVARAIKSNAIAALEARLAQSPDAISESELGRLYLDEVNAADVNNAKEAHDVRAHEMLVAATAALPSLSRAWLNLGISWERQYDLVQAELCYRRAALLDQSDYLPLLGLGRLCEARNDPKGAAEWYRKAMAGWDQMLSAHAYRCLRIYTTPYVVRDDIIPRGMMRYTEPELDPAAVSSKLSSLSAQVGDNASSVIAPSVCVFRIRAGASRRVSIGSRNRHATPDLQLSSFNIQR